ncbi:MAG TPA: glycosyl hydrolase [Candidatus Atribacteria bacterium]|nr:glycosyl hydrolase [Candidatus Atribacteria bacterium]
MKKYEGHDKPVYFTEMGWSDYGNTDSDKEQAKYLTDTLEAIKQHMPFVQTVHWFRLFNDESTVTWGGEKEANFGLMRETPDGFTPKEKGKAYYEAAGGKGDLYQFADPAQN